MKITPTPLTAALAGLFSALVLPWLWTRFGEPGDSVNTGLVVAFLVVVALPAQLFVVGLGRSPAQDARTLDVPMLKRVGAWLGAAAITLVVAQAWRG